MPFPLPLLLPLAFVVADATDDVTEPVDRVGAGGAAGTDGCLVFATTIGTVEVGTGVAGVVGAGVTPTDDGGLRVTLVPDPPEVRFADDRGTADRRTVDRDMPVGDETVDPELADDGTTPETSPVVGEFAGGGDASGRLIITAPVTASAATAAPAPRRTRPRRPDRLTGGVAGVRKGDNGLDQASVADSPADSVVVASTPSGPLPAPPNGTSARGR